MHDSAAAMLQSALLDPKKLPNYVTGMVLGPNDFRQVLAHYEWKHRNANLLLHGSGTVCGLKVSARALPGGTDAEIYISAGFAITPRGRWIRIERDQCAPLNKWLQAQQSLPYASPGPGAHRVYVTICYNQCLTDLVPIAGQQCAPDADNRAPSRILESYSLQFAWNPPPQPLEDRARLFGALMGYVEIVDVGGSLPSVDDSQRLLDAVRALAQDPLPVGSLQGSLPLVPGPFRLSALDADTTIREVLTIWVTEVCPKVRPSAEPSPLLNPAPDDCLLLAAVDFTVGNDGQLVVAVDSLGNLVPGTIDIDETQRPILVPTRILQELFTGGGSGAAADGRREVTDTIPMAPGGLWAPFTTVTAALPSTVPPDASIELSIESSQPPLPAATGNIVLTLYRPVGSTPQPVQIAATYLSTAPALNSIVVRWRAYQG
jgi:hypothetical protein